MLKLRLHGVMAALLLLAAASHAENWPRFRGENGDGHGDAADVPLTWTADDYAWTAPLPGLGHSSPVVWENTVYVTSADPSSGDQILMGFNLKTGQELWRRQFQSATYAKHDTNSFATSTPAVDAEQLYLAWKSGDTVTLGAFSHRGEPRWHKDIAQLPEQHGFGTSPIVIGDVVCLSNETEDPVHSVVVGLDRISGEELWRTPRETAKTTYATPCVMQYNGRPVLVTVSMGAGLTAYEPTTGKVLWNGLADQLPDRTVSSPVLANDLILISCGSGNRGLHMIAARPNSDNASPEEVWRVRQGVPNIPTPLVVDDLVFLWHDRGTVNCLDAATGKSYYMQRVGGNYHSSPLLIGDRIYCVSLDGEVVVIPASKDFEVLSRVDLGEPVTATPAVADGRYIIRTESSLLCLGGE